MNTIHLTQDNYQQYAPFDIVAVNVSFRKLYDKAKRVLHLDFDNPPPINDIVNAPAYASLDNAFDNDDWLMIESSLVVHDRTLTFRSYIHNSIKDEYLKYTGGELRWDHLIVEGILVHHQRVTLTSKDYKDFVPRKMMAYHSDGEAIDEYGNWFGLYGIRTEEKWAVFSNLDDFMSDLEKNFFHTGLGTGMWVDKSIAQRFKDETQKINYPQGGVRLLYTQWKELVWKIVNEK